MQTRHGSFIEAAIGTAIGFAISMALSMVIYPAFGHAFSLAQNVWITLIFTAATMLFSAPCPFVISGPTENTLSTGSPFAR